jgi:hypothetical protein
MPIHIVKAKRTGNQYFAKLVEAEDGSDLYLCQVRTKDSLDPKPPGYTKLPNNDWFKMLRSLPCVLMIDRAPKPVAEYLREYNERMGRHVGSKPKKRGVRNRKR